MGDRPVRILLVEDDEDDYILTRDLLAETTAIGYEVTWVRDYGSALAAMRRGGFDACLLDNRLGAERGIDLIREVVTEGCVIPIILHTGVKDSESDAQAREAGAAGYILKGAVDAAGLDRAIRYAIDERRRSRDEIEHRLDVERTAATVSRMLVASPGPDLVDVLRALSVAVPADRSYIVQRRAGARDWPIVTADGFDAEDLRVLSGRVLASCASGEYLFETLRRGDGIVIRDTACASAAESGGLPLVTGRAARGLLLVPVASARSGLWGFLGFETIEEPGRWPDEDVEALHVVGDIVRAYWERQSGEAERALLAAAMEQAGEAIVVTDAKGVIRYVNPAFERISGYSRQEAVGQRPSLLKSGVQDASFYEELWSTLTGGSVWTGHFVNRRKDGSLYHEEATISPVRDATGAVASYVATKRDVTREREIEEQFRQSQKMEAVGQLAGGIAHDFNNLLTVINGHAELLHAGLEGNESAQRDADEILKAGQRASSLVRQILAFSRKQVLQPRVISLNDVVSGLEDMVRRLIGETIDLRVLKAPGLGFVEADPGQVEQIVVNLVVNARDAMPAGGRLVVATGNAEVRAEQGTDQTPGGYVTLSVIDTGVGMDAALQKRIFEPFFTTKEDGRGTGLGLATVYGIVKQSGGDIRVLSEPGDGATFTVYLPRVDRDGEADRRPSQPSRLPDRGTETILVVEDEVALRDFISKVLSDRGYTVLQATDGRQALEIARTHGGPLDLAITDVTMPRMGGAELAMELAALRPDTRVLYMSGYTDGLLTTGGVLDPEVSLLAKPFAPRDLGQKVREVLSDRARPSPGVPSRPERLDEPAR